MEGELGDCLWWTERSNWNIIRHDSFRKQQILNDNPQPVPDACHGKLTAHITNQRHDHRPNNKLTKNIEPHQNIVQIL